MSSKESLFEALLQFRQSWVSTGWSWDRRFGCAASTFDAARSSDAEKAVAATFPQQFGAKSVRDAPDAIVEVANATGGVRTDQRVYATDAHDRIIAYALWWPWGGVGTNISLRVGLTGRGSSDVARLRKLFDAMD